MARLTNRPSVLSSRHSSVVTESQYDQENMDPDQPRHDKGKQRAITSTLPTPPSNDETARGQKRKRVAAPIAADENAEEDEAFTRYFDPNQNPDERREVKRQFRELERGFLENRDELKNDSGKRLTETVQKADEIFKGIKQTGDACPDSKLLVNVGDLAKKRSAALVSGDKSIGVDLDEFLTKALSYMRQGHPSSTQRRTQRDDEDDEDEITPLDWEYLGRHACFPYNARPPVPTFLLGPLSREKKQRAATQRRGPREKDTARESRPEALTSQDLTQSDQASLKTQCTEIRTHLKSRIKTGAKALQAAGVTSEEATSAHGRAKFQELGMRLVSGGPGLPLFQYVINPDSFGQTVENLFYVSFLIKEGAAGIGIDDDGLPVLHISNASSIEEQRAQDISKHQAVLSLDYSTWQDLIKAYNIKEPMIPHRQDGQATQIGSRGWYS